MIATIDQIAGEKFSDRKPAITLCTQLVTVTWNYITFLSSDITRTLIGSKSVLYESKNTELKLSRHLQIVCFEN